MHKVLFPGNSVPKQSFGMGLWEHFPDKPRQALFYHAKEKNSTGDQIFMQVSHHACIVSIQVCIKGKQLPPQR